PALALGNAVLLKPDPRTAVCGGVALARIFAEAGLPEGLLQVLPGGLDAGEAVVAAPEVSVISFTGSTAAGRKVGEAAGRLLKRCHLELGGNNALVVLPGAEVGPAPSAVAPAATSDTDRSPRTTSRRCPAVPGTCRWASPPPRRSRSGRSSTTSSGAASARSSTRPPPTVPGSSPEGPVREPSSHPL